MWKRRLAACTRTTIPYPQIVLQRNPLIPLQIRNEYETNTKLRIRYHINFTPFSANPANYLNSLRNPLAHSR